MIDLEFQAKNKLTIKDKIALYKLWNDEYPKTLRFQSLADFEIYLQNLKGISHTLLFSDEKCLIAWYFEFDRDDKKWFAIIIASKYHKKGLGTNMLTKAKENNEELNAWVIDHNKSLKSNGEVYLSPLDFYLNNGFQPLNNIRLETDKIAAVKIQWVKNKENSG